LPFPALDTFGADQGYAWVPVDYRWRDQVQRLFATVIVAIALTIQANKLMIVDRTTTIRANFKPQIVGWALPQSFDVKVLQNGGHPHPTSSTIRIWKKSSIGTLHFRSIILDVEADMGTCKLWY